MFLCGVGPPLYPFILSLVSADPEVHPQPETYWGNVNPIGPRACYDEGKRVAETLFYAYAKQEGVRIRVARIFNTYGPRMQINDGRVVSNFILQALQGLPITVSADSRVPVRRFAFLVIPLVFVLSFSSFSLSFCPSSVCFLRISPLSASVPN